MIYKNERTDLFSYQYDRISDDDIPHSGSGIITTFTSQATHRPTSARVFSLRSDIISMRCGIYEIFPVFGVVMAPFIKIK